MARWREIAAERDREIQAVTAANEPAPEREKKTA
jgi:hypothetical protein